MMQKLSAILILTSLLLLTTAQSNEISVKSYGAVGDGVTDDTEAIIEAVAALVSSASYLTSNILFFPEGTYLLSSSLPDNLTSYITIPEQPSYNQHYNYWILGTDEGSTEIIWNPSEGGLFSIESSINNLGGQIVLSKLSIRTTQAVTLNQNQVMFWSFGIPLVYVNQIAFEGDPKDHTVTVLSIGTGGPGPFPSFESSSFESGSIDVSLNTEHAKSVLQPVAAADRSHVTSITLEGVFFKHYRSLMNIHGFGEIRTPRWSYRARLSNSLFQCGVSDAPGSFVCDSTDWPMAANDPSINNVTSMSQQHTIYLEPTHDGTFGFTNVTWWRTCVRTNKLCVRIFCQP